MITPNEFRQVVRAALNNMTYDEAVCFLEDVAADAEDYKIRSGCFTMVEEVAQDEWQQGDKVTS